MHRALTRRFLMALVPTIGFAMPLFVVGCGEDSSTATPAGTAPKNFNDTHKDTLEQFKKSQGKEAASNDSYPDGRASGPDHWGLRTARVIRERAARTGDDTQASRRSSGKKISRRGDRIESTPFGSSDALSALARCCIVTFLSIHLFLSWEVAHEYARERSGFHPDRTAGCHRDHRRLDRPLVARCAGGARGRSASSVQQ